MKIYVAGKFEKKNLVREIFRKMESLGHSISYDWTTHKNIKPYAQNQDMASTYSQNEMNGICACDVLVYLAEESGHTLPMEFGAALALTKNTGKPIIYAVGKFNDVSPWFFNPLVKRVHSSDDVIKELGNNIEN